MAAKKDIASLLLDKRYKKTIVNAEHITQEELVISGNDHYYEIYNLDNYKYHTLLICMYNCDINMLRIKGTNTQVTLCIEADRCDNLQYIISDQPVAGYIFYYTPNLRIVEPCDGMYVEFFPGEPEYTNLQTYMKRLCIK